MAIYDFFVSRNGSITNASNYVGHKGRLFYDDINGLIRISDGITPGGSIVQNPALAASSVTEPPAPFEGMLWYNPTTKELWAYHNGSFVGTINPATPTALGGIKAGPGANVSVDGTLTIDTTGLPLSFGDFVANVNILTMANADEDMVLATSGNAEVQLIGNIGFYRPNGLPPQQDHRYFYATDDGQITILVPQTDPANGAVKIIGTLSGQASSPVNTGVMLHVTGNNNDPSRIYNDGINSFAAFVGRRINGTVLTPTAVQAGDEIIRISSTGYNGTEVSGTGSARIVYQAIENYTPTATGSNISLWTCAIGSNVLTKIATVDSANGVTATKFNTTGNVNAGNIIVNGSIVGNAVTTTATIGTGNISTLNVTGNSTFGGNIQYNVATNNATVTQLTSKATAVTANGRTGQITTSNSSLAKGGAVTFTVNNSYITSATDVVVVSGQNGATPNSYAYSVTRTQVGSFNITIVNSGHGALTDTLVLNFAVIKVS